MSYRMYCRAKEMRQLREALDRAEHDWPERTDIHAYLSGRLAVLRMQCELPEKNPA